MVRHGVVPIQVREILRVPKLFAIWMTLPHDMMSLMHHVFSALNLIDRLKDVSHDSTPSISSPNRPTSSSPLGPPPPPPPPHVSPYIDHPPPPHVSPSTDPPLPPHVSTSMNPPRPRPPPHLSQVIDVVDIMFISGVAQIDPSGEIYEGMLSSFVSNIMIHPLPMVEEALMPLYLVVDTTSSGT